MFGLFKNERMKELFTALGVEYTADVRKAYSDGMSAKAKRDISLKEVVSEARIALDNRIFPYYVTDSSHIAYPFGTDDIISVKPMHPFDSQTIKDVNDPEKIKADMEAKRKEISEYTDTIVAIANDRLPDNENVEAKVFVGQYDVNDFFVNVDFYLKGKEMIGSVYTI